MAAKVGSYQDSRALRKNRRGLPGPEVVRRLSKRTFEARNATNRWQPGRPPVLPLSSWRWALDLAKFPILVVDDEPDNLDAFRFNFGKEFPLRLANSAEEALALARAEDVAVVVTDQRMPR